MPQASSKGLYQPLYLKLYLIWVTSPSFLQMIQLHRWWWVNVACWVSLDKHISKGFSVKGYIERCEIQVGKNKLNPNKQTVTLLNQSYPFILSGGIVHMLTRSSHELTVALCVILDCNKEVTFDDNLGFHGWYNYWNDNANWNVHSGSTPSANTGPSTDHTLGTAAGKFAMN